MITFTSGKRFGLLDRGHMQWEVWNSVIHTVPGLRDGPYSGKGLLERKSTPSLGSGMDPKSGQGLLKKKLTSSLGSGMGPKSGQGLLDRNYSLTFWHPSFTFKF